MGFKDKELDVIADEAEVEGRLEVGDTVRFSHAACIDRRKRGYISRKYSDTGSIVDLFFCHNCASTDCRWPETIRPSRGALLPSSDVENVELPPDIIPISTEDTPAHIKTWAHRYGVAKDVSWSPSLGRIIMPVWQGKELIGYQARRDPAGSTRIPKYITVARKDTPLRMHVFPERAYATPPYLLVVLVEDWISAHQFRDIPNVVGAPLFGVHANAEYLMWLDKRCTHYDNDPRYLVWLDNDVPEAQQSTRYLARLLSAMGRRVIVEAYKKDPKDTPTPDLTLTVTTALEAP